MEPKWLQKSINKSEVFVNDFGTILEGFWEHFGGLTPGAACGGPRRPQAAKEDRRPHNVAPRTHHPEPGEGEGREVIRAFGPLDHVNNGVKRRFALVASRGGP